MANFFAKHSLSSDVLFEFICFPSGGAFYLYSSVLNLECIVLKSEAVRREIPLVGIFPYHTCAADFSLLNLPKGKSLGRSNPATNS